MEAVEHSCPRRTATAAAVTTVLFRPCASLHVKSAKLLGELTGVCTRGRTFSADALTCHQHLVTV